MITNIYLSDEEFALLSQIEGQVLSKTRHRYLHRGSGYSIDVFEGQLQGLLLAELHAGQGPLADGAVPDFAIGEVTGQLAFTGGELVQMTPEQVSTLLQKWLGRTE